MLVDQEGSHALCLDFLIVLVAFPILQLFFAVFQDLVDLMLHVLMIVTFNVVAFIGSDSSVEPDE